MNLTPAFFEDPDAARRGRFARAGRVRLYYETYGRGKPLLLFHGGLSCIDGLRYQIAFFARHFKVIVPERPGHGHTPDTRGFYSYEELARQTAAFMDTLGLRKARMLGYSDGANLIFPLAAKRPDLVDRFVSVGGNIHHSGCEAPFQKELRKQKCTETDPRYAAYSPDGADHYREVFEKCRRLWLTEPKWKLSLIKKIRAPGLILAGDRDMIRHEHSIAMFRALRRGRLALIPGASHSLLKEKPALVNAVLLDFFQEKIAGEKA